MPNPLPFDALSPLPLVLAGPLLRRIEAGRLVFWLVASEPLTLRLMLQPDGGTPRSPLNWFTKRRRVWVQPWLPSHSQSGERLWNGSGIGRVRLDAEGRPLRVEQVNANGSPPVTFAPERD